MGAIEARHEGTLSNASSSVGKSKSLVGILVIRLDNDLGGSWLNFVPLELAISEKHHQYSASQFQVSLISM